MTTKRHPYEIQNRRGMILLLVVAVLVLLALMGTVYILSASTDKQVSYASNDQANLNYATQGMLSVVRADILNTTLGPNGTPLALGSATPARVWTGPDLGYVNNGIIATPMEDPNSAGTQPTNGEPQIASQPWLCGVMPWEPNTTYPAGVTVVSTINNGGNPPSGTELVCGVGHVSNPDSLTHFTMPTAPNGSGSSNWLSRPPGANEPFISILTPELYDPTDGTYDIAYSGMGLNSNKSAGNGGIVYVPNASVVMPAYSYNPTEAETANNPLVQFGTRDAMWNLLPYSSPNGTHYRFAVRIMDTSAMMNVNTGYIDGATSPSQSANNGIYADTGAAMAGYPLYAITGTWGGDSSANMQASNMVPPTRAGSYAPTNYDLLGWEQELEYYENQGIPNTNGQYLNLYGSGTELQWLSYGGAGGQFGLMAVNRLGSQMLDTFGSPSASAAYFGPGYTSFYTTYSWSRQYASAQAINAPPSLLTGAASLYPSRVNLNSSDITTSNAYTLAAQIVDALSTCGFNASHACAFAANYFSYRYGVSGASSEPAVLTNDSLNSPVVGAATGTTALPISGTYFIGNTAQPFINEMEATLKYSGSNTPTVEGYAIELKNPYPTTAPISLTGWQLLVVNSAGTAVVTIPLTSQSINGYAAGGYFLVASNGTTPPVTGTPVAGPSASNFPTTGTIILTRPCTGAPADGAAAAGNAIVDAMGYTIGAPGGANPTGTYYVDASRVAGEWGCDSGTAAAIALTPQQSTAGITLGASNTPGTGIAVSASGGAPGLPLYDRFADGDPVASGFVPSAADNYQILNWADANCIARECSMETAGGSFTPISWQIGSNGALNIPAISGYTAVADEGFLARIYFDFPFDSRAALTSSDMPTNGPVEPSVLSMLSLGARADDAGVTPTGVAYANLLTRTPGLINVNTAGEVPLYDAIYTAAFSASGGNATNAATYTSQLVADAIAYRDRLGAQSNFPIFSSTSGTVTATGTTPAYNAYPGYNIRSLGDLLLAWLPELEAINKAVGGGTVPGSFLQRDILWADCANNFCVHSDSFAVYGLVQAIRLNPNYLSNGGNYVDTDWYNASQETPYPGNGLAKWLIAPTSSISVGTAASPVTIIPEFILEGQRRFVAIVDSSYSTPPALPPKIVAMKILPQ